MKKLLIIIAGILLFLIIVITVGLLRSDFEPQIWQPAPLPALEGEYAQNDRLAAAIKIPVIGHGPEDVAQRSDGAIFTGLEDGRIVQITAEGIIPFANTGGRPLGIQFDSADNLIVADGRRGLISIAPDGAVSTLVTDYDGETLQLVDDLDIASDGTIWFSNVSQRRGLGSFTTEFIEMKPTGSLLSYNPATGATIQHLDKLYFANGVALGPDEAFVLVNETSTGRIIRLWLKGDKAGEHDLFHEGLPGGGDNLSFNGKDRFWVAVPSLRLGIIEWMADKPLPRKILSFLPPDWLAPPSVYSMIIALDVDGNVIETLQDTERGYQMITSVNEFDGMLYIGSLTEQEVAVLALD